MDQALQLLGAVVVLTAFAALQTDLVGAQSRLYLSLNLIGSVILAAIAWNERQFGFFLLNVVWALFAVRGLVQRGGRDRTPGAM
ncbi:MAG: CBU_0592 family membrane protein [Solirubrobacterales bacterium]